MGGIEGYFETVEKVEGLRGRQAMPAGPSPASAKSVQVLE